MGEFYTKYHDFVPHSSKKGSDGQVYPVAPTDHPLDPKTDMPPANGMAGRQLSIDTGICILQLRKSHLKFSVSRDVKARTRIRMLYLIKRCEQSKLLFGHP